MLAQNFMTAPDLKIRDDERDALVKVLGMLERAELVYMPLLEPFGPNGFNMTWVRNWTKCGTVCCIKGWCQTIGGIELFNPIAGRKTPTAALQLFMYSDDRRENVTVEQAATALRNYLTTGHANWDEVLA